MAKNGHKGKKIGRKIVLPKPKPKSSGRRRPTGPQRSGKK